VEGYTLRQQPLAALRGPSPLLRLASDERLIQLTRGGQQAAFEVLVARYHARLLAFCRHMLRSREDAEDVLQEVFAAAFNAIMADSRKITARPWLYRIARNRSLNHLRRNTAIGVDSMDAHFADAGQSTSEKVHKREEFRLLLGDIGHLPETQRSALVLREMDALSYEQIAVAMDTTVPSVKSLLVRARVGLAEAAEARKLTCDEVRLELGAAAEGISSLTAPIRRHVKGCERCRAFRTQLRANNRALAAIFPLGPFLLFKKAILLKLGLAKFGAGGAGSAATAAGGGGAIGGGTAVTAGSAAVAAGGGIGSVAMGVAALKAVAVVATVAAVGFGASSALHSAATSPAISPVGGGGAAIRAVVASRHLPALRVKRHRAGGVLRHRRFVPVLVPVLSPASPMSATTTAPIGATAPAATPATDAAPAPTPGTTTATQPDAGTTATPTTQEISTTTVFPGGATSTGGSAPISTTGTTGSTTPTGSTGTTGTTGSTGPSGSTGATGSTNSTAAASPTLGPQQGGATAASGS
jgi:RNA polymerase sigma factor (sigma-70 family)